MTSPPATDPRIVYGARCTWWGAIDQAAPGRPLGAIEGALAGAVGGIPGCPHCGGPLFEVVDEATWWAGVDKHEAERDPGYRGFIEWLRGRCFSPSLATLGHAAGIAQAWAVARATYERDHEATS